MLARLMLACFLSFALVTLPTLPTTYSAFAATKKAKKKISHKRSDFSAEQREKFMEEARKICKRRYGAGATVYKLDYYQWKVWCLEG